MDAEPPPSTTPSLQKAISTLPGHSVNLTLIIPELMDDDEFGIAAFEDPAPSKDEPPSSYIYTGNSHKVKKAPKRRLRYRADIEVDDTKYKGKRATREQLELDTETLGLFSDDDGDDDDKDSPNELTNGSDDETEDEAGENSSPIPHPKSRNQNDQDDEERAIAKRLEDARVKDQKRGVAVRKQKAVYDAMVNFRIQLEPLVSIARSIPSKDQRTDADDWSATDELSCALQSTQSSLKALSNNSQSAWETSWPMPLLDDSSDEDIESDDPDSASPKSKKVPTVDKDVLFEQWRDTVLNQWGKKVTDATGIVPKGGFKSLDTSVSSQIQGAISTGKHLERTQRVKEPLPLLGADDLLLEAGVQEEYFDDGEFYRTLLREIIESGEAPGGGLRYAQLAKQGRVKKKASIKPKKAKRINYQVHEKMVGFLTASPLGDLGPLDEIMANLFGVRRKM